MKQNSWWTTRNVYLDFVVGTRSLHRMVFKNITHNEFDWSWEGSKDSDKSWTVVWPIHYKRR